MRVFYLEEQVRSRRRRAQGRKNSRKHVCKSVGGYDGSGKRREGLRMRGVVFNITVCCGVRKWGLCSLSTEYGVRLISAFISNNASLCVAFYNAIELNSYRRYPPPRIRRPKTPPPCFEDMKTRSWR